MASREEIFAYVKKTFRTEPEYPWERYPHYAVLRHSGGKKWYGLIMNVPQNRLGLCGRQQVDIINLRSDCTLDLLLTSVPGVLPAYHMNKKNWISVILDGGIATSALYELINTSHALTKGKTHEMR